MAFFASQVKTSWDVDPDGLIEDARLVADAAGKQLHSDGIEDNPVFLEPPKRPERLRQLPPEQSRLLLKNSISALPLHKTMVLMENLHRHSKSEFIAHERLALAKALVTWVGNLHFGPEVGVGELKPDAPVISTWLACVQEMAQDLIALRNMPAACAQVFQGDARADLGFLRPNSIDAVITSPPYPNEKDYTRTTRLESVLLGFLRDRKDLRRTKQQLLRSNTRNVYKDDTDDQWIANRPQIQDIAEEIEARRISLGKTSGFERMYHRVTRLYFGGMTRHLAALRNVLRPGAQLAYVVGDQASYLGVMIETGRLLAEIAVSLGYRLEGIDLFRTRWATATRQQLREEVVVLRWPRHKPAERK